MPKQQVHSPSPYEKDFSYCRAVRVDKHIWVSGSAPIAEDGTPAYVGDPYRQALHCFKIMTKAIEELGGKKEDIVRTRMFITEISIWEEVGKAHGEFFKDVIPATTMVEVKGLINPDWLVEVEADAYIQEPLASSFKM